MIFDDLGLNIINNTSKIEDLYKNPTLRQNNTPNIFRSSLMVKGDSLKHLNKLDQLEADVVVINLEDGISPQNKPMALKYAALYLSAIDRNKPNTPLLSVRVNSLDEGGLEEIVFLNQFYPEAIRIPKIKHQRELEKVLKILNNKTKIHLTIETKEAYENLKDLKIDDKIEVFYLGLLDLFNSLKLNHKNIVTENPLIGYLNSKFVYETLCIDIIPVSFTFQDYENLEMFKKWATLEKMVGFVGKNCISPKQAIIANSIFEKFSSENELEEAKYIKNIFESNAKKGITGFSDSKYGFIDEPIYKNALNLINSY